MASTPSRRRQGFRSPTPAHEPQVGHLIITGHPLDLAIGGEGWFVMSVPGEPDVCELTRVGTLVLTDDGALADERGCELFPQVRLPGELSTVVINSWGDVVAITRGGECRVMATMHLADDSMASRGHWIGPGRIRLDLPPDTAATLLPGEGHMGLVLQGAVEVPPGYSPDALGPRFAAPAEAGGLGASLRLTSTSMEHFARFLRHARRRRDSRLDFQVARSQAAMLLNALNAGRVPSLDTSSVARSDSFSAVLAARRLTAPKIADQFRYGRRYVPERFDVALAAGGAESERSLPGQELQVAQARASKGFRAAS
jgi:hypothetical protein